MSFKCNKDYVVITNGQSGTNTPYLCYELFDIGNAVWNASTGLCGTPSMSNVVGSVIKQFDTASCDAVFISQADHKMYTCKYGNIFNLITEIANSLIHFKWML